MENEKLYQMPFAKIYPLLKSKAVKKGRMPEEVDKIICWLTGYSGEEIAACLQNGTSYGGFFENAPCMNPKRELIKGSICGMRIEEIGEPLMRDIRRLDKLIDELARGKPMEKILRG